MNELCKKGLAEIGKLLRGGEVSSVELTEAYLGKIERRDPKIGSFITRCPEQALAAARAADDRLSKGTDLTPLTGVPLAIKDIFVTRGIKTT